jgi:hypothetical protein
MKNNARQSELLANDAKAWTGINPTVKGINIDALRSASKINKPSFFQRLLKLLGVK